MDDPEQGLTDEVVRLIARGIVSMSLCTRSILRLMSVVPMRALKSLSGARQTLATGNTSGVKTTRTCRNGTSSPIVLTQA